MLERNEDSPDTSSILVHGPRKDSPLPARTPVSGPDRSRAITLLSTQDTEAREVCDVPGAVKKASSLMDQMPREPQSSRQARFRWEGAG
jgi:hypothetical protein